MRCTWLALLILMALTRWTTAEINMADTLEWISADADVVVVGKVTKVVPQKGEGQVVWYDTTLAVSETLKGPSRQTVRFVMRHMYGDTPETWQRRDAELLVFLVDSKRTVKDDPGHARAPFSPHVSQGDRNIFDLAKPQRAYTTAFGVITKRDDLLALARVATRSKAKRSHRIEVPWDSDAHKALYGGSAVYVYVPVDAALEQIAIGWLASADANLREEGARALAYFKSQDNIVRIEKLLGDPATVQTGDGKTMVKRYLVRKQAHETLVRWGVAHKTPVIEEPLPPRP